MVFELRKLIKERDEALFSFDRKKIVMYYRKYGVPIPKDPRVFWGSVAKAVLGIVNAPEDARDRAKTVLDELGWSYDIRGRDIHDGSGTDVR